MALLHGSFAGRLYHGDGSLDPPRSGFGFNEIIEADLTAAEMLRVIMAGVSGRTEGIGTNVERYYSIDGSKPRITATFDSNGNRVSVVIDGSP